MGETPDETNGSGGTDDGGDSNDFRTPVDYDDLVTIGACLVDLEEAYEGLANSLGALGPDVGALEQDQVAAFWERYHERRAEADELRDRLQAETLRLTLRPILKPPWPL